MAFYVRKEVADRHGLSFQGIFEILGDRLYAPAGEHRLAHIRGESQQI